MPPPTPRTIESTRPLLRPTLLHDHVLFYFSCLKVNRQLGAARIVGRCGSVGRDEPGRVFVHRPGGSDRTVGVPRGAGRRLRRVQAGVERRGVPARPRNETRSHAPPGPAPRDRGGRTAATSLGHVRITRRSILLRRVPDPRRGGTHLRESAVRADTAVTSPALKFSRSRRTPRASVSWVLARVPGVSPSTGGRGSRAARWLRGARLSDTRSRLSGVRTAPGPLPPRTVGWSRRRR